MNDSLLQLIDTFTDRKILVIGDAMVDVYIEGGSGGVCTDAPVPLLEIEGREESLGGAANSAANIRGLGGEVRLLAVAGDDPGRRTLERALSRAEVSADDLVVVPGRSTMLKTRVHSKGQILLRYDQGSTEALPPDAERALIAHLRGAYEWADAVVVSDYGYGVLTPRVIEVLEELRGERWRPLVADCKDLSRYRQLGPTAIKPNYGEVVQLLHLTPSRGRDRVADLAEIGGRLLHLTGAAIAAVTLDADGALIFEPGKPAYRTFAHPTADSRATGAGDTYVAAMALGLAARAGTEDTADIAAAAANVVVRRDGTTVLTAQELRAALCGETKVMDSVEALKARIASMRDQGARIVFTNGCFDLLHSGHVSFLQAARSQGDVLVVAVNDDESVGGLKGEGRPINALDDRMQVLAALTFVDLLVPFAGNSPEDLIEAVTPDVYVKGGNYRRDTLPETDLVERLGGLVEILPYVQDYSTHQLLGRIRSSAA
jgi:D-beta-D-heptose 7-phosphate kinase/D-beta-D-heptose 1-phosphate adenosyltransferase